MTVGWLDFNVPSQHKYVYIRDDIVDDDVDVDNDGCSWATAAEEATSSCADPASATEPTTAADSSFTASADDEKTDNCCQQREQRQDGAAEVTDDNSQIKSDANDQLADADVKRSSTCQLRTDVVAASAAKLPRGTIFVFDSLLQFEQVIRAIWHKAASRPHTDG